MIEHIKDIINHLPVNHLPFLMVNTDNKIKLNSNRIIEAIIIAIIAGLFSGYVSVQKMDIRLISLEHKVDKMFNDIYKPKIDKS